MTALAQYYHTQRQTVSEMRLTEKLGAKMAKRFHQVGAVEILENLRSALDRIENRVSKDLFCEPEFRGHLQDWKRCTGKP